MKIVIAGSRGISDYEVLKRSGLFRLYVLNWKGGQGLSRLLMIVGDEYTKKPLERLDNGNGNTKALMPPSHVLINSYNPFGQERKVYE